MKDGVDYPAYHGHQELTVSGVAGPGDIHVGDELVVKHLGKTFHCVVLELGPLPEQDAFTWTARGLEALRP